MEQKISFWQRLYRIKAHHVVMWICYYGFFMIMYKGFYPSFWKLFGVITLYFAFTAPSFYFIGYFLFPRYLYTRKYGKLALSVGATVVVLATSLSVFLYFLLLENAPAIAGNKLMLFLISFLSIGTISGIMCAGKLVMDKINGDRNSQMLEKQRVESELQYLKAQVNPHFLFNAINNIYFLIKKDPNLAAETLIRLSDLLRFQLYDCTGEKINIESEIEYLRNFVALEAIRKGSKVKVAFETDANLTGFFLAPFLLIPFMENAFKYVSNRDDAENAIKVILWRDDKYFHAQFCNTTDGVSQNLVGGIGHKNVKRRLDLIYPDAYKLDIAQGPDTYRVLLDLKIQ